ACTATVTAEMINNGSFDLSGNPPTVTMNHGTSFGLGTIQVTLTASNGSLSSTCTANVTVVDATPPVITAPANVSTTQCLSSASVTVGTATATDNCRAP